jgi:hypothetical protein
VSSSKPDSKSVLGGELLINMPSGIRQAMTGFQVLAAATRNRLRVQPATLRRQFGQCVNGRTRSIGNSTKDQPKLPEQIDLTIFPMDR